MVNTFLLGRSHRGRARTSRSWRVVTGVGSTMIFLYTPKGNKTQVDVFGDLKSDTIPSDQLEQLFLGLLEYSYNEDALAVKAFALKK